MWELLKMWVITAFTSAYLAVGGIAVLITLLAFGLKSQSAEQATVQRHEAAAS